MVIQQRSKQDIETQIEDMPADYVTSTQFAVGIIQAADIRKFFVHVMPLTSVHRNCTMARQTAISGVY
jgi:hypothetical protein